MDRFNIRLQIKLNKYNNVYHPYSYEGFIDFTKIKDVDERKAYETHIREFGQTPR